MFRYSRCCLASLILSYGWVCGFSLAAEEPVKLNFLVILVDDIGWTGLSGYGSDLHETPHIDRLAVGAMKFTSAYASASICTPTRAALMTGKYPARLNMTIWHEASRTPPQNRKLIPPIVEGKRHNEMRRAATNCARSAESDRTSATVWHLRRWGQEAVQPDEGVGEFSSGSRLP